MSSSLVGSKSDDPREPLALDLTGCQIAELFPFHAVFNSELRLTQAGPSLRKLVPELKIGTVIAEVWELERPLVALSYTSVLAHVRNLFIVRVLGRLRLRGQMVPSPGNTIAFLCSPWLPEPGALTASGLTFEDFPLHDSMPELYQLVQTQRLGMEDLRKLTSKLRQQKMALREANVRQLEQSAESRKLALIAARTDNGVVVTDANGLVEWVNESFTRITGFTFEELRGKTPASMLQGPETDPDTIAYMRQQLQRGESFDCEVLNYHKSGARFWVAIEVQPMRDERGRVAGFIAIEQDITFRKKHEARKDLAYAVSTVLAESVDGERVLTRIVQAIVESVGSLVGVIWRLDKEHDTLYPGKIWSVPLLRDSYFEKATRALKLRRGAGLPGTVLQANAPMWISDLAQSDIFVRKCAAADDNLKSGFAFPIRVGGEARGVMEVFSSRHDPIDEELLATLSALGTQIGQFMERQDHEAERARLVSLLHSTLESTAEGILVIDQQRRFVTWNQRFLDIWGLTAEVMRHPDRGEVERQAAAQVKAPESFARKLAWWHEHPNESGEDIIHFRNGRVFERTTQPQIGSGEVIGRVWSYRDITERWFAVEQLRESEEQYRVITAAASDAILTIDRLNRILFANQAAARIFGYAHGDLVGRQLAGLMGGQFRDLPPKQLLRIVRGTIAGANPRPAEVIGRLADGSEIPLEVTFGPSHLRGERVLTGVIRDITERRATQEKLEQALQTTKLASVVAETANRAKSDFLASISHEIRTPLNSIAGLIEILRQTSLDEEQRDMVETIWTGSESLLHLINDLLDFSKIEAGQVEIVCEPFDPLVVCERAVEIVKSRAQRKGLDLVCCAEPATVPRLMGDANRIGQIIVNLLNNGVKFTESGSVVLTLGWKANGSGHVAIEFQVVDTGIGIKEADRAKVFEKFYRADTEVGRRAGGTGLGLSISLRLAESMAGTLELTPMQGGGSCFTFRMPGMVPVNPSAVAPAEVPDRVAWLIACAARSDLLARAWRTTGLKVLAVPGSGTMLEPCDVILREAGVPCEIPLPGAVPTILIRPPNFASIDDDTPAGAIETIDFPLTPTKMTATLHRALGILCGQTSGGKEPTSSAADPHPAASARVLLVEDYADSASYAKRVLERAGHKVTIASSAAEAVKGAQAQPFDIIFMDLLLPDGSGMEATKAIREHEKAMGLPRVPVIALTAHALQDYRELAFHSEMDDYLTKPIRPATLVSAVADRSRIRGANRHPVEQDDLTVLVRSDMADLVPGFLKRVTTKLQSIEGLLAASNFAEVVRIGHNLKGSGATYGFEEITCRGDEIESAGRAANGPAIVEAAKLLLQYLSVVHWQARS